jgi:hypothetical protein
MDHWAEFPMDAPGAMNSYAHGVTAQGSRLTVLVRAWKKFPTLGEEAAFNLDAISLIGPAPSGKATQPTPEATLPQTGLGHVLPPMALALAAVAVGLSGIRLLARR